MKTRSIARGIVGSVAALLGVMAAGCSAETGDEAAEIGSTSEALSISTLASTYDLPAGLEAPGTCEIQDKNGTKYLVVAGGFQGATALSSVYVGIPETSAWAQAKNGAGTDQTLSVARGQLLGIADPSDPKTCVFVGGAASLDGSAVSTSGNFPVEILTADTGTAGRFVLSHAVSGGSNYAQIDRTRGRLVPCTGTHKVLYFGGKDSGGTSQDTIVSFDISSPTTAWSTNATHMSDDRFDFGIAKDGSNNNFVVVAGNASGAADSTIDLFKTSSSCGTITRTSPADLLAHAREGNGALYMGTETIDSVTYSKFLTSAGKSGSTALKSTEVFRVNWATPALKDTGTANAILAGNDLGHEAYRPAVVQLATSGFMIGGTSATDTFTTGAVNETPDWTSTALAFGRRLPAAEFLSSTSKVYVTGGAEVSSGTASYTNTVKTEKVTP